jgi:hypothetical protein
MNKPMKRLWLAAFLAIASLATAKAQTTLPSTFALPSSAADTSKPGFIWNVSEVANAAPPTLAFAEAELAGLEGPNLADPNAVGEDASGPAAAPNPATAPVSFKIAKSINFSIVDQDSTHNNPALPAENQMPGLPGTGGSNDNIAAEALTYLDLPAGTVTMGVRSDDGFQVTIGGAVASDKTAPVVGITDGGRGAADTVFSVVVPQAGLYAARLLYDNGGGDASVEWYTLVGTKPVLINDTANGGIKAYQAVTTPQAYPQAVQPVPNSTGASPQPTISAQIVDGAAAVATSSITLKLDGSSVTPQTSRAGTTNTVTYPVPTLLAAQSTHSVTLGWTDNGSTKSITWSFTTTGYQLLDASSAVTADTTKPGFLFNIFANSNDTTGDNNEFDYTEQGLNGLLVDSNGAPLANLAAVSATGIATGPAAALATPTSPASFQVSGPINISSNNVPGLPASDGLTDGVKAEILTYVSLPAGLTGFSIVNDGFYQAYVGSWDYTKEQLAARINSVGTSPTTFFVYAKQAGTYPLRLAWDHTTGDPGLALSTVGASGKTALVNDTANGGIAAYRALSTPGGPYVKYTSPKPVVRQVNVPSTSVLVRIVDGATALSDSSPALTLNSKTVTTTTKRAGNVLEVTYTPTTLQTPAEIQSASLTFKDTAGNMSTDQWSFMNLKAVYLPATSVASDNFDEYTEGTLFTNAQTASSWYVWNFTAPDSGAGTFDVTSPTSDSYMNWVVVGLDTFSGIEGSVINVRPGEMLNGQPLVTLASGNIFAAESDNRVNFPGQVQFAISKAFNLSSVSNAVFTFSSLYKQNQDSLGAVEYTVDGGTNWLPVIYYMDGAKPGDAADVVVAYDGTTDAIATFETPQGDAAVWTNAVGQAKGGKYGDGIAAPITQALAPFIAPRVNDDNFEGKRLEVVRLPMASGQKDVRIRLAQLGTCSWYFAVDNFAFYDIAPSGATVPTGVSGGGGGTNTVSFTNVSVSADHKSATLTYTGTLQSADVVTGPWTPVSGANSPATITITPTGNKFYRVQ